MATYTNVIGSDIGDIRLLITDTDLDNAMFSDEEIERFLALTAIDGTNNIKLASAMGLEVIARSEVLIQKKIKLLDLTTDGPAVAKELREQARLLKEEASADEGIDVIEWGLTKFNRQEIVYKDALKRS
jgi:hypothetical protein